MCIFSFNYITYYFSFCTNNMFVITQAYSLQDGSRIDGDSVRDVVFRYDSNGKRADVNSRNDDMLCVLIAHNASTYSSLTPRSVKRYIFLGRLRALVSNWMKEQDGVYRIMSKNEVDTYLSSRLASEAKRQHTERTRSALATKKVRVFEPRIQVGNGDGIISYEPFNNYVPIPQFENFMMMSEYGKILLS